MNREKKITVIVPIYNAEKWLDRCLGSIVKQTIFNEIYVILIDDGSDDDSGKIADQYAEKYSNIICRHIENGGVSNARNIGLEMCKTNYVNFIDADDYVDENYLEDMMGEIDINTDIVCTGFIAEYENKSVKKTVNKMYCFDRKEIIRQFLIGNIIEPNVTDKLFRMSVIENIRFDSSFAIAEDKLFLFNYLKKANKVKVIPIARYHYYMNDKSACRQKITLKKFHSLEVSKIISDQISKLYPDLYPLAESAMIDVSCRVFAEIYRCRAKAEFRVQYEELRKIIKSYKIIDKYKYSSKKHFFAFLVLRVNPYLYCWLKNEIKFQYK